MVNSCSAFNCTARASAENKARGITFHMFPKESGRRLAWALATRRANPNGTLWLPSYHSLLCSQHFNERDFEVSRSIRRLKKDSVPSVFHFNHSVDSNPTTKHREIEHINEESQNVASVECEQNVFRDHSYSGSTDEVNELKRKLSAAESKCRSAVKKLKSKHRKVGSLHSIHEPNDEESEILLFTVIIKKPKNDKKASTVNNSCLDEKKKL